MQLYFAKFTPKKSIRGIEMGKPLFLAQNLIIKNP